MSEFEDRGGGVGRCDSDGDLRSSWWARRLAAPAARGWRADSRGAGTRPL